jgi:predicted Zn-ribbon and HTH transcriptional regulator
MGHTQYDHLKIFNKIGDGEERRRLDASLILKYKLSKPQQDFLEEWFNNGHDQLEAFKKSHPDKIEGRADSTIKVRAYQLMNATKIQNYLKDFTMKSAMNPDTNSPIITVNEVITNLATIIKSETAKDSDKIKASEVVLKHLNAFSDHNSSRAPKILNYIQGQSTDDLIDEIHLLQEELIREGKMLKSEPTQNNYADYEEVIDLD